MDRAQISAITHGDLAFHNPIPEGKVDEALAHVPLAPGEPVLDVAAAAASSCCASPGATARTVSASTRPRWGLALMYLSVASQDDWNRYEWTLIANGERHGAPPLLEWVERARARLLAPGGQETMGFALVLLSKRR